MWLILLIKMFLLEMEIGLNLFLIRMFFLFFINCLKMLLKVPILVCWLLWGCLVVFMLDMGALILWGSSRGNKQNNVQEQICPSSSPSENTEKILNFFTNCRTE